MSSNVLIAGKHVSLIPNTAMCKQIFFAYERVAEYEGRHVGESYEDAFG